MENFIACQNDKTIVFPLENIYGKVAKSENPLHLKYIIILLAAFYLHQWFIVYRSEVP